MGNAESSCTLSAEKIDELTQSTHFSANEIRILWVHFNSISDGDDMIEKSRFHDAVLFRNALLAERVYSIFDSRKEGAVNFLDYINGMSRLSNKASVEEKVKFSFEVYDKDQDGLISLKDLQDVLLATIHEHKLVITAAEIDQIIEATFKEADPSTPGFINYDEYRAIVSKDSGMLSHLSLNISSIIEEYVIASNHT